MDILGLRVWIWAQGGDLSFSYTSVVIVVMEYAGVLPRAHVDSSEKQGGAQAGDAGFGKTFEIYRNERMYKAISTDIYFLSFLRWSFTLVTQAGVQWRDLASLQPLTPRFK